MADKANAKDRLKEITDSIETGIQEMFTSEKYMQYLRTMSRFHQYSVNNTMLIYMQKPDATLVAGFNKWRDQFGRNVKRGEKSIKIIAPTPYKKKIEQQKLDPETKAPVLDADGKVVMEEKEVRIPMYKVVSVFDASQTDGKPLPTLVSDLAGHVQNYEVFLEALRRSAPVPITIEKMSANMDGFFSPADQRIAIREGMSEVQTISAVVHEIAHSKLHNYKKTQEQLTADAAASPVTKDRNTEEVEAESVSFAVCAYYGIATGENSFAYIATWSKDKELPELRASLETINKTASELISDIDRNFAELCKERGIDLTAEPETVVPEAPTESAQEPEKAAGMFRYYITPEALERGSYPPANEGQIHESVQLADYEGGLVKAYGFIDYSQPLTQEQLRNSALLSAKDNTPISQEQEEIYAAQLPTAVDDQKSTMSAAQEKNLDEYPMPDSAISMQDMLNYGYLDNDMLPLTRERALELLAQDVTVYQLMIDNRADMVFDEVDVNEHGGIFGIERAEWDDVRDKLPPSTIQQDIEQKFRDTPGDAYLIYQLKANGECRDLRFDSLDSLQALGKQPERENYNAVYTAPLSFAGSTADRLNAVFFVLNEQRPADFYGHSASVSDIIALKQDGKVSCHYIDAWSFPELPAFLKPENYLKNAEMSTEDDYGMIDGIINNGPKATVAELEQQARSGQPISLMDLADAVHREQQEKKPSVLKKLQTHKTTEKKQKTAPKKSAEMEH